MYSHDLNNEANKVKKEISHDFMEKLTQGKKMNFLKDDFLFVEGENARGIFFIESGIAKVFRTDKQGKEYIFYLAKSGDVLGTHAIINHDCTYHHSVRSLEAVSASFTPKAEIEKMLTTNSGLNMDMMQILCKEIDLIENKINHNFHQSSRQRLAEALLALSSIYKKENRNNMMIPLTFSDLANLAGTSTTYLVKLLSEFNKNKWIEVKNQKVHILNPVGLKEIVA